MSIAAASVRPSLLLPSFRASIRSLLETVPDHRLQGPALAPLALPAFLGTRCPLERCVEPRLDVLELAQELFHLQVALDELRFLLDQLLPDARRNELDVGLRRRELGREVVIRGVGEV